MTAEPRITFSDWETRIRREEAERLNGKPMDQWGSRDIAEHCRAADKLPELNPQEYPEDPALASWTWPRLALLGAAAVLFWVGIYFAANASTLEPQYDETGRPYFAAEGPQCWSGKYHGEPMDCALIDVTYRQEVRPKARPCVPFRGFCETAAQARPDTYLSVVQAQSQTQSQWQAGTGGGSGSMSSSILSLLTQNAVTYQTTTGDTFLTQITQTEVTLIDQDFSPKDCPPDETITETPDPSLVPLPAGAVLLLSGLGLLAWRKK